MKPLRRKVAAVAALPVLVLGLVTGSASAAPDQGPGCLNLVDVGSAGLANGGSGRLAISGTGRYVVYMSSATNLVRNGPTLGTHLYVRDLVTGRTSLVDVGIDGKPGNLPSTSPTVSGNGRFVLFTSDATNLVAHGPTSGAHVYLRDLARGRTVLVDRAADGGLPNGESMEASLDDAGDTAVFMSTSTNLVPGKGAGEWNIYSRNLITGRTQLVTEGLSGADSNGLSFGPAVNPAGTQVVYDSLASDLVSGDANKAGDVFLYDLRTHQTSRIDVPVAGGWGDDLSLGGSFSDNGRYVGFASHSTNMAPGLPTDHSSHAYVRDLQTGTTTLVDVNDAGTVGNSGATWSNINGNGRSVVFISTATNLAPGASNGAWTVYRRDLDTNTTTVLSVNADGQQAAGDSWWPMPSANNRTVAFLSFAANLSDQDTNTAAHVFVHTDAGCATGKNKKG